jgi:hypothetical protein
MLRIWKMLSVYLLLLCPLKRVFDFGLRVLERRETTINTQNFCNLYFLFVMKSKVK